MSSPSETRTGLLFAGGAYAFWGFAPLYWKLLGDVSSSEQLAHRLLWSLPILALLVAVRNVGPDLRNALRTTKTRRTLVLTTVLIGGNWFLFLWAIDAERVLEASLGYFITPLLSVFLGYFVLGERPRRPQWIAIAIATAGVLVLVFRLGSLPWVALTLAGSFGLYGLLRKTVDASPIAGLTFEVSLLAPLALVLLGLRWQQGNLSFGNAGLGTNLLLLAAGPVTVLPLVWFTNGARRLSLATLGLLQYLAPSLQFLLAVLVFGETFTQTHLIAFSLIWLALALYTGEAIHRSRSNPSIAD